ncbi:hypothetical protein UA08_07077 [Talaromyces atroroseus]|uniref:Protein RTA1 n=1 Tax=Talaromyces atroroseus TaxID=1441469 RepID=A0A225AEI4_TALAT|nr:hypothetical protein UA08_07077 [Talaromyces atroroseus]OKL57473.1 hypothetical protein UA08_07077 [Talaromyces atroroseus]
MASGTISSYNLGEHITVAGLGVQLLFFSFFMVTCVTFHYRIRRNPTAKVIETLSRGNGKAQWTWETVLAGLYIASILILVRSIFRLIEYAQGNSGYLISHEVFMYVFDAALMFLAMLVMNICHPTTLLVGSRKQYSDTQMESLGHQSDNNSGV